MEWRQYYRLSLKQVYNIRDKDIVLVSFVAGGGANGYHLSLRVLLVDSNIVGFLMDFQSSGEMLFQSLKQWDIGSAEEKQDDHGYRARCLACVMEINQACRQQYVESDKMLTDRSFAHTTAQLERGCMDYGCSHYRRRCKIRAPCCNEMFDCRHCHNEAKNIINVDKKQRHDIPRHQVQQVICSLCGIEQEVRQICISCGVCMGKYFCETCKFFDDDTSKKQYHCEGCGICRIGGRENFFHCNKCRCCYSVVVMNSHPCIEGAMHQDCPVCFEYLFESTNDVTVLRCGHTIHANCLKEMQGHFQYACPLCSKSVCDMSKVWEKFDMEIAATPMPQSFQNKRVCILCNDCGVYSEVQYHIVALKCPNCKSYNTRLTS